MFQNSCFTKSKIVLTISLTSSSNPECKVSIGDQLEVKEIVSTIFVLVKQEF